MTKKEELIAWIKRVDDLTVLLQVDAIKSREENSFDFNEELKKGYKPKDFKTEMSKRIKAYPWKK